MKKLDDLFRTYVDEAYGLLFNAHIDCAEKMFHVLRDFSENIPCNLFYDYDEIECKLLLLQHVIAYAHATIEGGDI